MSVVVAIKDGSTVHFACDGQYTDGRAHYRSNPKWIKGDTFLIALTGKSLIRQIIQSQNLFTFTVVNYENVCSFSILLREMVKQYALQDENFTILIGGGGNVFRIHKYDVIEVEEYDAIGSGSQVALGVMYGIYSYESDPRIITEKAVRAAVKWVPGVGGKIYKERL